MMHVVSAAVLAALALTSGGASDGTNVAWVALLSGRSENMTDHALLQIASVRRASKHEHVTMVTPDVEGATRARLRDAGSRVVEVAPIQPRAMARAPAWWAPVFTKLRLLSLTGYRAVAFLDLDAFLASPRADEIFDACPAPRELCAVREYFDMCPADGQASAATVCPRDAPDGLAMLSAGVMVARPDRGVLARLLARLREADRPGGAFDANRTSHGSAEYPPGAASRFAQFPEQELLSAHYLRSAGGRAAFAYLAPRYGECEASAESRETGRDIVHDCGALKYMHLPLCSAASGAHAAAGTGDDEACRRPNVRLFQELLLEADPCAARPSAPTEPCARCPARPAPSRPVRQRCAHPSPPSRARRRS